MNKEDEIDKLERFEAKALGVAWSAMGGLVVGGYTMGATGEPIISCIAGVTAGAVFAVEAAIAGGMGFHHVAERDRGISRTQTNKREYNQQPTM